MSEGVGFKEECGWEEGCGVMVFNKNGLSERGDCFVL